MPWSEKSRSHSLRRQSGAWPVVLIGLAGCSGPQSALDPAGVGAARIADLFWWMTTGAAVVWTLVMGTTIYALRRSSKIHDERTATALIIGGGVVFPTVVLGMLLAYGLSLLSKLVAPAPEGALRIVVIGEQWWWRIRYTTPEGQAVETANEIRLPVGEPVEFRVRSADVIHAFWIPSLGGKIDALPGRETRLVLEPTRTGRYRGVCAEYCGISHALMNFDVVVMERSEFRTWLDQQSAPAHAPATDAAARGQASFLGHGCGACHTIRGTPADGVIGPDLTHVGSRLTLGGSLLTNEPAAFLRWLEGPKTAKPGVHMPAFGMLEASELSLLAEYLESLQ